MVGEGNLGFASGVSPETCDLLLWTVSCDGWMDWPMRLKLRTFGDIFWSRETLKHPPARIFSVYQEATLGCGESVHPQTDATS
jgi:hypothetical protein